MSLPATIAFLGAGKIAQAIMGGLIRQGMSPGRIKAADPSEASRAQAESLGIAATAANAEAAEGAEAVMVCVKPNVVAEALRALPATAKGGLFVSVAAGITTSALRQALGKEAAIVRCMPNTPALVGQGMTALYAPKAVGSAHRAAAEALLAAVGETLWVQQEADLDAVTAVSGSGPAYFFHLMEAMMAAAEAEGLPAPQARQLVLQTALGSARMALEGGADPAALRAQVTSPGGTTEAALNALAAAGFPESIAAAIAAAKSRAQSLSQE